MDENQGRGRDNPTLVDKYSDDETGEYNEVGADVNRKELQRFVNMFK